MGEKTGKRSLVAPTRIEKFTGEREREKFGDFHLEIARRGLFPNSCRSSPCLEHLELHCCIGKKSEKVHEGGIWETKLRIVPILSRAIKAEIRNFLRTSVFPFPGAEHIVMTPKCKTASSTTLIIERQVLEPPTENGNENNVHVAGGDHKGIVINKQAVAGTTFFCLD